MALCESCKDISSYAYECTINANGLHHSFDDKPSYESWSRISWHLNGRLHRLRGPAVEFSDGDRHWYLHGKRHRLDGPAILNRNGREHWRWHYNRQAVIPVKNKEIIVGKPISIGDSDVATVLKNIEGCFYEVLLGNKKVLIVRV